MFHLILISVPYFNNNRFASALTIVFQRIIPFLISTRGSVIHVGNTTFTGEKSDTVKKKSDTDNF